MLEVIFDFGKNVKSFFRYLAKYIEEHYPEEMEKLLKEKEELAARQPDSLISQTKSEEIATAS